MKGQSLVILIIFSELNFFEVKKNLFNTFSGLHFGA